VLFDDGFTSLDPSHPLGGRDGGKDAIAWRSGEKWVMAVYFPRGRRPLREIKEKLVADFAGVAENRADGLAFVTNQELSLSERSELKGTVPVERASTSSDYDNAFRLAITVGLYLDIKVDRTGCLAMAEAALRAARALKDSKKEAAALNNVGLALNSMQRFSEAKSIFLEARKRFQEIGDRSGQASVLLGLSDVLRAEGLIKETIGPLRRAVGYTWTMRTQGVLGLP
jgi:tetratricopeptide (TPR) repeat protein